MPVLVNKSSTNFEDVPDVDAALASGQYAYPLVDPNGKSVFEGNADNAATLLQQGYRQPSLQELQAGLNHAKVNTLPEKIGSVLEGGGEGASTVYTGLPASTAAEVAVGKLLGIKELSPEMIALRHKYNTGLETAGNIAGAGLAAYFGGEAGALNAAGKVGVNTLGKAMGSELTQFGSTVAKNAIYAGVMSGDQELGKFMYDPQQTAEKAVANVGLNVAAGGLMGAAIGSVPLMWNKTRESAVLQKYLQKLKEGSDVTPRGADLNDMFARSGVSTSPETQQIFSANPLARSIGNGTQMKADVIANAHKQALDAVGIDPEALTKIQEAGDGEIAAPLRAGLAKRIQDLHTAEAQAWDTIRPTLKEAGLTPEAKASLTERLAKIQEPFTSTKDLSEEWGITQKAIESVPAQKTMGDFKNWRSAVLQKLWGKPTNYEPDYPRLYWSMHHALDDYEGELQESTLAKLNPELVPALQQARQASAATKGFINELNKTIKFGQTGSAQDAIARISDDLKLPDTALVNRFTPTDNDPFLVWAKQNMPELVPSIQNAYRQRLVQAATTKGGFDAAKMIDIINNPKNGWSQGLKRFIVPDTSFTVGGEDYGNVKNFLDLTFRPRRLPGPPDPVADVSPGGLLLRNNAKDSTISIPKELVFPDHPLTGLDLKLRQMLQAKGAWHPPEMTGIDKMQKLGAIKDLLDASKVTGYGFTDQIVDKMLQKSVGKLGSFAALAGSLIGGGHGAALGWTLGKVAEAAMNKPGALDPARAALLKVMETGVIHAPAFKAMTEYFSQAMDANALMTAGMNGLMKGTLAPAIDKKLAPDPKANKQLAAMVNDWGQAPEKMLGIGGDLAHYLPDHHQQVAAVAGRAQAYLSQLKPNTEPLGPLDSPKQTSKADMARYERALNLVNNPLSVIKTLHQGNITQDDLAVLEGVYPSLYREMQQKILAGIQDAKAKGKTVPYKQRLAFSTFLGINLDSTIGPMTMMTLMQNQKPPTGQPGMGGPGQRKPSQSALGKMQKSAQSDMTMAQKAERDRVGQ